MAKGLIIIGLILTMCATILLYLGSRDLPWELQTFEGASKLERSFYEARSREMMAGFILLFSGFLFQLIGTMIGAELKKR